MDKTYLSTEEQYKEILNNEEIERIQDYELREIRQKYWNLRHKAFLDEAHISDQELESVWENLKAREQDEIKKYRQKKGV